MNAWSIELHGITAHFRDNRFNTGGIDIPLRTFRCPPPSTLFGLLCAAKGGWIEPATLKLGWKMSFTGISKDFQRCKIPEGYIIRTGFQNVKDSPVVREFLSFPVLSILAIEGVSPEWFQAPVNPLALGRAEDLVTGYNISQAQVEMVTSGNIENQFLPAGIGYGALCSAPLYFDEKRIPYKNQLLVEANDNQTIQSEKLMKNPSTGETFFLWNYE